MIKLSDAVQPLPRQVTCNVHGVGANFLAIGRSRRRATAEEYGGRRFNKVGRGGFKRARPAGPAGLSSCALAAAPYL